MIISVRIDRDLYEKIKSYGIIINQVIRSALEEEVRKKEEELMKGLDKVSKILSKIPEEESVEIIRSSRE